MMDKREKYCKCDGTYNKLHPILNVASHNPYCNTDNQTDKCKEHGCRYDSPEFHLFSFRYYVSIELLADDSVAD